MSHLPLRALHARPPRSPRHRALRSIARAPGLRALPILLILLLPVAGLSMVAAPAWAKDPTPAPAKDAAKEETASIELTAWLVAGPQAVAMPALADEGYGLAEMLAEPTGAADGLPSPAAGRPAAGLGGRGGGTAPAWRRVEVHDGRLAFGVEREEPADAYRSRLALYLEADRFVEASLSATGGTARYLLGGEEVAKREGAGGEPTEATLELLPGRHLLVVETASEEPAWEVAVAVSVAAEFAGAVRSTLDPRRGVSLGDLLDTTIARDLSLSPDGRTLAVTYQQPAVPAEHQERWIELLDAESGEVLRTLRSGEGDLSWAPAGGRYAFSVADSEPEGASRILLANLANGELETLARGVENLEALRFLPDGSGLIVQVGEPEEDDERGVKRYRQLTDRWAGWRGASHLYSLDLEGGMRRLTVGGTEHAIEDLAPGGRRLLISRKQQGLTERPYSRTELVEIELATLETRTVLELGWFGSARYSPDGDHLLVLGSAALFGGAGNPLPEGTIANDYDTQAYLVELASGEAKPLSRDFEPTFLGAEWSGHDGHIYLRAQDAERAKLFRLDPESLAYTELPSDVDMVGSLSVARSAPRVAFVGQGVNRPGAVFVRGLDPADSPHPLADPGQAAYADVDFGRVEPWTFTAEDGTGIDGRVYYPLDFDPSRKYPLIVYYYGGTVPVGRSFGGRYPKELWAARGYFVYVPQPSGATGYGLEFSSRHVNAWGQRTADEILEGTRKFLEAHPQVDPSRVGAIGASYGGFMTMYLQTRTDLFAAAVSHAGISNLSSYWGRGWWGYLYSAAASAESFPWNNRDLYVGQSPLFSADQIRTPLLLLHGDADVNVPPVESHQMYTALKLLGREVELIEIGGEDHTILTYPKRKVWARTILAWFDRYLKGEPEAWEHLWGTRDAPKG